MKNINNKKGGIASLIGAIVIVIIVVSLLFAIF